MYVYSCKSGQMYRINLLFKLWLPAAWKVHGGPCASVHLAKCLKSNQMFIPTWQYSISGHDFCGLSFVKECALNPRVLKFFKSSQPLFNIKSPHNYFHEFFNPMGNVLLYQEYSSTGIQAHYHSWYEFWGLHNQFWCDLLSNIICHFY